MDSAIKNFLQLFMIIAAVLFFGCGRQQNFLFKHDITTQSKPWTTEPTLGSKSQFSFAIISDLNSGERKGVFDVAVEQIKLLRPTFTMSIGDLVDGGTEDTTKLNAQFDYFDSRVKKTGTPFFHVGGNHDLTNITMRKYWEKRYGRRYYHFIYNNVLFLILDTEDYDEKRYQEIFEARARAIELIDGGKRELAEQSAYFKMPERKFGKVGKEQSNYFIKVIRDHPNVKWTFLFMHKPVWQSEGKGNLVPIEAALNSRNYTLFNGHFHAYSHTLRNDHDYIMLGTTGGGQDEKSDSSFDHITLVTFEGSPFIANLRLDGILDRTGKIPAGGDSLCFQASKCKKVK